MRILAISILFILIGCSHLEKKEKYETLTIAVSANMQFAMKEIVTEFKKNKKIKIEMIMGSSGKLTNQIIQGAPFDLFISADTTYTQKIVKAGKGNGKPYIYAIGTLILWTNTKQFADKKLLNELRRGSITKISLPNPSTAPYGLQAKNALTKLNIWEEISSKIVIGESIAQATQYVYSGVCEVGFTAKSMMFSPELKGKGYWEEVPKNLYDPIHQGMIITKWGQENHAKSVEIFESFMKSPAVKQILLKNGYQLPTND